MDANQRRRVGCGGGNTKKMWIWQAICDKLSTKIIKMGLLFSSKPSKRVNLSQLFLSQGAQPAPKTQPANAKTDGGENPVRLLPGSRPSRSSLSLLLLVGTVVVAMFLIISLKSAERIPNTANSAAANSVERKKTIIPVDVGSDSDNRIEAAPVAKDTKEVEQEPSLPPSPATTPVTRNEEASSADDEEMVRTQYKVNSKAYFYKEPSERSGKTSAIRWKKSYPAFNALSEENGFVYVVITNDRNEELEGWLRKKDLTQVQTRFYEGDLK